MSQRNQSSRGRPSRPISELIGNWVLMYLTLSHQFYWRTLYKDVVALCQTCDLWQRSKRHFGRKVTPLNPILSPSVPFQFLSCDHKVLCRKTRQGNVAILCIIDQFSGFPILKAVKDCSARTTAEGPLSRLFLNIWVPWSDPIRLRSGVCVTII